MSEGIPSLEEQRKCAYLRYRMYADDLLAHAKQLAECVELNYDYAIETANTAIRVAAQVRAINHIEGN